MSDHWAENWCPKGCANGTQASHGFYEAVEPANTVLLIETGYKNEDKPYDPAPGADPAGLPGYSLAYSPLEGNTTSTSKGHPMQSCSASDNLNLTDPSQWSIARMFADISWRHSEPKRTWCLKPSSPAVTATVAYSDGHVKIEKLGTLADFRKWSIKQGKGDTGYIINKNAFGTGDGVTAYWYP